MRVSQFFAEYNLSHADIQKIEALPNQHSLVIFMGLSSWMQKSHEVGQPDFIDGKLLISGVRNFVADPGLNTLKFGEHTDGEVISFGRVPERDSLDLEASEIVMNWYDYDTRINIVVILSFLAKDVEWIPKDKRDIE